MAAQLRISRACSTPNNRLCHQEGECLQAAQGPAEPIYARLTVE